MEGDLQEQRVKEQREERADSPLRRELPKRWVFGLGNPVNFGRLVPQDLIIAADKLASTTRGEVYTSDEKDSGTTPTRMATRVGASKDYFLTLWRVFDQKMGGSLHDAGDGAGLLTAFVGAHPHIGMTVGGFAAIFPAILTFVAHEESLNDQFNKNPALLFAFMAEGYSRAQQARPASPQSEDSEVPLDPAAQADANAVADEEFLQFIRNTNEKLAAAIAVHPDLQKYQSIRIQLARNDDTNDYDVCLVVEEKEEHVQQQMEDAPVVEEKKKTFFQKFKAWEDEKWEKRNFFSKFITGLLAVNRYAYKFTLISFLFYWITWGVGSLIMAGAAMTEGGTILLTLTVPGVFGLSVFFVMALPLAVGFYVCARQFLGWLTRNYEPPAFIKSFFERLNRDLIKINPPPTSYFYAALNGLWRFLKFSVLSPFVLIGFVIYRAFGTPRVIVNAVTDEKYNAADVERDEAKVVADAAEAFKQAVLQTGYEKASAVLPGAQADRLASEVPGPHAELLRPLANTPQKPPSWGARIRYAWINFIVMSATLEFFLWFATALMSYGSGPIGSPTYESITKFIGDIVYGSVGAFSPLATGLGIAFLAFGFLYALVKTWYWYQEHKDIIEKDNAELEAEKGVAEQNEGEVNQLKADVLAAQSRVAVLEMETRNSGAHIARPDIVDATELANLTHIQDSRVKLSALGRFFKSPYLVVVLAVGIIFADSLFFGRMFFLQDTGVIALIIQQVFFLHGNWFVDLFVTPLGGPWVLAASLVLYAIVHTILKVGHHALDNKIKATTEQRKLVPVQKRNLTLQLAALKAYEEKLSVASVSAASEDDAGRPPPITPTDFHTLYPDPEDWNATLNKNRSYRAIYAVGWLTLTAMLALSILTIMPASSAILQANMLTVWISLGLVAFTGIVTLATHLITHRQSSLANANQRDKVKFLLFGLVGTLIVSAALTYALPYTLSIVFASGFLALPVFITATLFALNLKKDSEGLVYAREFLTGREAEIKAAIERALVAITHPTTNLHLKETEKQQEQDRELLKFALDAAIMALNPNHPGQIIDVARIPSGQASLLNTYKQLVRIRERVSDEKELTPEDLRNMQFIFGQLRKNLSTVSDPADQKVIGARAKTWIDLWSLVFVLLLVVLALSLPTILSAPIAVQWIFSLSVPILVAAKLLAANAFGADPDKPRLLSRLLAPRNITKAVLAIAVPATLLSIPLLAGLAVGYASIPLGIAAVLSLVVVLPVILKLASVVFEKTDGESRIQKLQNWIVDKSKQWSRWSLLPAIIALAIAAFAMPVLIGLILLGTIAVAPQVAIALSVVALPTIFLTFKFLLPKLYISWRVDQDATPVVVDKAKQSIEKYFKYAAYITSVLSGVLGAVLLGVTSGSFGGYAAAIFVATGAWVIGLVVGEVMQRRLDTGAAGVGSGESKGDISPSHDLQLPADWALSEEVRPATTDRRVVAATAVRQQAARLGREALAALSKLKTNPAETASGRSSGSTSPSGSDDSMFPARKGKNPLYVKPTGERVPPPAVPPG